MTIDEARQVIERVTSTMPASPFRDAVLTTLEAYEIATSDQYLDRDHVLDLMTRLCVDSGLNKPEVIGSGRGSHLIGVRWGDVWLCMSPAEDQTRFLYVAGGRGEQQALGVRRRPVHSAFSLSLDEAYSREAWTVAIRAALPTLHALLKPASEPVQPVAALARIKAVVRAPVRSADAVGAALADVESLEAWCLSLAGLAMFEDGATLDEALIEMGEDEE